MRDHIDRFTLDAYIEQALPATERRVVEVHITACPTCQARLAAAKQLPALLYQLPREKPAPNLAARIHAAVAAQRAPTKARWMEALVPVTFGVGLVLLVLAAPQWNGWAQAIEAQLPTEQMILTWLGNLVIDPTLALESVTMLVEPMLSSAAEDMGVLLTSATTLLAVASMAGLVQLLGSERPLSSTAGGQA